MKKIRYMNEKTVGELKQKRGFLHRMSISIMAMFMFFLMIFLYGWCFTTDSLVPLISLLMTILSLIFFGLYILKRDLCSVLIFLKESVESEKEV